MTLSDGTFVRLARGATLRFPAALGRREVVLDGRAFFAVSRSGEPFSVRTSEGDVTVLGTRFQVESGGEGLEVVVVEGVVEVAAPGGTARALADQVATVRGGGAPVVTSVADVWSRLDWPSGLLVFQGTPLSAVAAELARFYRVDVEVQDTSVAGLGITGSFQAEPLESVVEAVCAVTGIRCEVTPDGVVIGARGR
jgi:transmembrane sensor